MNGNTIDSRFKHVSQNREAKDLIFLSCDLWNSNLN
jgi:hypothetical protein